MPLEKIVVFLSPLLSHAELQNAWTFGCVGPVQWYSEKQKWLNGIHMVDSLICQVTR